jgi:hypothetical protein
LFTYWKSQEEDILGACWGKEPSDKESKYAVSTQQKQLMQLYVSHPPEEQLVLC